MKISPRRIAQQAAGKWTHSGKVDWDQFGTHTPKRRTSHGWKAMARRTKHRINRLLDKQSAE